MKFILATHNPGKLREMSDILSHLGWRQSPADMGTAEVEETGTHLRQNAAARQGHKPSVLLTFLPLPTTPDCAWTP